MQYRVDPKAAAYLGAGAGLHEVSGAGHPDAKAADAIISRAVEQGINYLDTAYLYPGNEDCVGLRLSAWVCATGFCSRPSCRTLRANVRRISTAF